MNDANGLVHIPSSDSVDKIVARLLDLLRQKNVTVFALVDHSGEAHKAGLSMRPTQLVIFGNPQAGTPVMNAAPTSAIDLPLKILVRQDETGKAWVSYNSVEYLRQRHGVPPELAANLAAVKMFAENAAAS